MPSGSPADMRTRTSRVKELAGRRTTIRKRLYDTHVRRALIRSAPGNPVSRKYWRTDLYKRYPRERPNGPVQVKTIERMLGNKTMLDMMVQRKPIAFVPIIVVMLMGGLIPTGSIWM